MIFFFFFFFGEKKDQTIFFSKLEKFWDKVLSPFFQNPFNFERMMLRLVSQKKLKNLIVDNAFLGLLVPRQKKIASIYVLLLTPLI
jgi:hypothetical protein